ncbi:unnamed protein product [Paramecium primaurelia]|uniref:Uncharacterized protein n=1 Tax=Paramecium primaurelia TaxID=5886 RepID=A0A8S1PHH0_PARPR|nr:unnamed protein product [Paramecium primaurelia]CAD8102639.1 unnamed protein product [Paramecium primaurelia]
MSLTLNQKNNSFDQDNQSPLGIKQEEIIPINFKKNRKAQYYQKKHLLIKRLFMDQVKCNIAKKKKLLNLKGDEFLIKLKLLEPKQEDIEDQISTFEICLWQLSLES